MPRFPGSSLFTRPLFLVVVSVLVAMVFAVIFLVGSTEEDGKPAGEASAAAGGPSPKSDVGVLDDGCPDLPASPTGQPVTAPQAEWKLYRTLALPYSSDHGPAQAEGDVIRCFARTPTGAVFASMHIPGRLTLAKDWRPIAERQTTGPGRKDLIEWREKSPEPLPEPTPGELGQMAGFGIVTYSPDTAVVEIVTRFADTGMLQVSTITLKWSSQEGDWQYELAGGPPPKEVDSLDGYVPFAGL